MYYASPEAERIFLKLFFGTTRPPSLLSIFFFFVRICSFWLKPFVYVTCLQLLFRNPHPATAVVSNSMLPVFRKGDFVLNCCIVDSKPSIKLLKDVKYQENNAKWKSKLCLVDENKDERSKVGQIALFKANFSQFPIVHRIISEYEDSYVTKGDNNDLDDIEKFNISKIRKEDVFSMTFGVIPLLGHFVVLLNKGINFRALFIVFVTYVSIKL